MKFIISSSFLVGILFSAVVFSAIPIAVIVHPQSKLGNLTQAQVLDIYTGRIVDLPNNQVPLPLDFSGSSPLRESFYFKLSGKTLAQVNAYWARLLFSGQATPPRIMRDSAAIIMTVSQNPNAIGFVDAAEVNASVKVLFKLE
jgi:ABC-type phosphate transport system substrate-binding protein